MLDVKLKQHISFSSCTEVNQICARLLTQTPVKVFDYSRVYPDGSRLELSSHAEHLEHVFMIHKETRNLYTPALVTEHDRFLLTTPWIEGMGGPVGQIFKQQLQIQHEQFNLGNEFCIINMHARYMEVFHFYADSNTKSLENYYLNNIQYFEQFTNYFIDTASPLIQQAENQRLILAWRNPGSNVILPSELNNNLEFDSLLAQNFEKPVPLDILPRKFYFKTKEGQSYLTKREVECAIQLVNGKNNKQIAEELFISPRTVDSHIDSIRFKTGLNQRGQIIRFFLENGSF